MNEQVTPDQSWSALAELAGSTREQQMIDRCREAAALPLEDRLTRLESMVRAEYALDDDTLRAFTSSRLRAWLTIDSEDHEAAEALARGYDAVFDRLPGTMAMRRATMVQTVARQDLTLEEVDQLFQLVPSLVRSVPRATSSAISSVQQRASGDAQSASAATATASGTDSPARPWWKFWSRDKAAAQ